MSINSASRSFVCFIKRIDQGFDKDKDVPMFQEILQCTRDQFGFP